MVLATIPLTFLWTIPCTPCHKLRHIFLITVMTHYSNNTFVVLINKGITLINFHRLLHNVYLFIQSIVCFQHAFVNISRICFCLCFVRWCIGGVRWCIVNRVVVASKLFCGLDIVCVMKIRCCGGVVGLALPTGGSYKISSARQSSQSVTQNSHISHHRIS